MRFDLGPDIEKAKAAALSAIDLASAAQAEAVRPARLAGMDAARLAEAQQILESRDAGGAYPMLRAMPGGGDLFDRARLVVDAARITAAAQLAVEARRLAAKAEIRAATLHAEIRMIVAAHKES